MATNYVEYGDPYAIAGSGSIALQDGILLAVIVSQSTSGVLTIVENRTNGRTILNAMPVTAGQVISIRAKFIGPLTVTVVSGTLVATAIAL